MELGGSTVQLFWNDDLLKCNLRTYALILYQRFNVHCRFSNITHNISHVLIDDDIQDKALHGFTFNICSVTA